MNAALELHDLGFAVLPVRTDGSKKPLLKAWTVLQKKPAPRFIIECWFTHRWPNAGIGIVTGVVSGIDVLDLDTRADPSWPGPDKPLPDGLIVRTPSGGCHRYFAHVPGYCGKANALAVGVDTRTTGNYAICPPTLRYEIIHGDFATARKTPCPDWLREALLDGQKLQAATGAEGEAIPRGQRNDTLTRLAGSLRRHGAAEGEILASLGVINRRCEPPLGQAELRRIAGSIGKKDPAPKSFALTDIGNGERFAHQHSDRAKWTPEWGWLYFDGRAWRRDQAAVERLAKETACRIYREITPDMSEDRRKEMASFATRSATRQKIDAMLAMARSELAICTRAEMFDQKPFLLNCENGTLDLALDGELRPHDPDDLLTQVCGAPYKPDAQCPTWLVFLDRIFAGNQNLIAFLQRACGYSLSGDVSERCLFFCYGRGANGKSTLLTTFQALLANYAQQANVETFLARDRRGSIPNDIAALQGARLVCSVESGEGRQLAESLIKHITGKDRVRARYLYHEEFEFVPQFKLWIATNHKPTIKGTDDAIWSRICLVPFNVTIPPSERDPSMFERLCGELSGILAWGIQGCRAWQRDEGLLAPQEVRTATEDYRTEMDILGAFIADCCIEGPGQQVTAKDLYEAFSNWAKANGELVKGRYVMPQRTLGILLAERGFVSKSDGRTRSWGGIGLPKKTE